MTDSAPAPGQLQDHNLAAVPTRRSAPVDARGLVAQLKSPAALLEGRGHVYTAASESYRRFLGGQDPIGKAFREVLPELVEQGFEAMLDRVFTTGEPVSGTNVPAAWDEDGDGDPEPHIVDFVYQPLRDADEQVWGIVVQVTDRTEEARLERERAFLAEASDVLASSLDYHATLSAVTRLAVQGIADWCAVDELLPGGTVRRIAVAHPDSEMVKLAHRLQEQYPPDPEVPHGVLHVLRTGEPELVSEIPDEFLVTATRDEEHLRLVRALGLRSYIAVPLVARGNVFGALSLVAAESGRRFEERDLQLAQELARRAAVAIDNARLYRDSEEVRRNLEDQATELESQAEELQHQAMQLEETQMELEASNEELAAQVKSAEQANLAKTQFLTVMSHELRTPLNAIIGYEDLLEAEVVGPINAKQKDHLLRIKGGARQLLELINQILSLARIESGREEVARETVHLVDLIRESQSLIEGLAQQKGLLLRSELPATSIVVETDSGKVRQILLNLLGNAVKFTETGQVDLSLRRGDGVVEIRVRDTGPGIPRELHEHVFEPFVQVDLSPTRAHGGTGLGLPVSRELARLLGGDLVLESEVGVGSTFTLTLPDHSG